MENISPSTFQLSSIFVLIALWIYFFVYSYRHYDISPWGFGIVIVGILISGIGFHFYDNHIVVFSITLSLVVGLIGMLWNVNNIRNHFYIRNIGELLRFIGVGLIFGLLFGFIGIITLVTKHFQVPSQYTVTALIAISVQGSMAEELLFRAVVSPK